MWVDQSLLAWWLGKQTPVQGEGCAPDVGSMATVHAWDEKVRLSSFPSCVNPSLSSCGTLFSDASSSRTPKNLRRCRHSKPKFGHHKTSNTPCALSRGISEYTPMKCVTIDALEGHMSQRGRQKTAQHNRQDSTFFGVFFLLQIHFWDHILWIIKKSSADHAPRWSLPLRPRGPIWCRSAGASRPPLCAGSWPCCVHPQTAHCSRNRSRSGTPLRPLPTCALAPAHHSLVLLSSSAILFAACRVLAFDMMQMMNRNLRLQHSLQLAGVLTCDNCSRESWQMTGWPTCVHAAHLDHHPCEVLHHVGPQFAGHASAHAHERPKLRHLVCIALHACTPGEEV